MTSLRGTAYALLVAWLLAGCSEVAEVLSAPAVDARAGGAGIAGAATATGGTAGANPGDGNGGEAGQANAGGAAPENPALGVVVDAGDAHACAARFGALYCWGENADGRLGVGDDVDRNLPARVGFDADWTAVATGVAHTCALKVDGSVWCFGANNFGQLGQGSLAASSVPLRVALPAKVVQLSSGANTACVVLAEGELYCWGRNWEGNIGLGDSHPGVDQPLPIRSGEASDWALSGTGDGHTCAVRGAGSLFGWGRNSAANLGLGQTVDQQRRVATQIGTDEDWVDVVSGQDASCGLRGAGLLFCWGGNTYATLGLGDRETRLTPTQLGPPGGDGAWQQVSLDTFHACAVDSAFNLHCWGRNLEGQLGTADNDDRLAPAPVGAGFVQVAVGRFSSCGVTTDAHISCAGDNNSGQLGSGDTARRNAFTEVAFP